MFAGHPLAASTTPILRRLLLSSGNSKQWRMLLRRAVHSLQVPASCFSLRLPRLVAHFLVMPHSDCCDDASTACGLPVPNCPTQGTGDGNADDDINVLDVVLGVNFVTGKELNTPLTEECFFVSMDVNTDGDVNVLDLVAIINVIIGI
eukprot:scaffold518_cov388-Prasinococcus_capsulatus_cf.AAC.41